MTASIASRPLAPARPRLAAPAALILALGALLVLLLVAPGGTVVTRALDQLFLAYDGIHRVLAGPVPGPDAGAAAGPLAILVPAWAFHLSGGHGGALPMALAINLLLVTPVAAHVLASRLRPGLALAMAAVLLLALAAPMHPGEPVTFLSYSGFPNRIGWVATALLLVMVLAPRREGRRATLLDAAAATVLTLLALYTQASFGIVALAVLLLVLLAGPRRSWAGLALLAALLAAAVVELAWEGTRQPLADLAMAFVSGGWLRAPPEEVLRHLRFNLADYLLVGLLAAVTLRHGWSPRLLLVLAFGLLARAWLIDRNDPRWSVLALHAMAAVLAEHLLRALDRSPEPRWAALLNPAGVQLYLAALVAPTAVRCASALLLHTGAALGGAGMPLPFAGFQDVRLVSLWTDRDFEGSSAYLEVVADGVEALSATGIERPRILTLGAPDTFSAVLDLPLPRHAGPDLGRLADRVPPAELLADIDVVIEPLDARGPLRDLLWPEIEASFPTVTETRHWRLHRRTPGAPQLPGGAT